MGQKLSAEDYRATLSSAFLDVLARHGGERIVAGPPMERLVDELVEVTERMTDEGLRKRSDDFLNNRRMP